VLLLPHGYDGQGPEHSSGRVERFLQLVDDDEDSIPGKSSFSQTEMQAGFDALDVAKDGAISREEMSRALARFTDAPTERIDLLLAEIMTELGCSTGKITREKWFRLLESWCLQNSERKSNLVIVVPSTPAQYFHCLRRQIHRPFSKPLICFSGKWLLHHKACVSSLEDMTVGTFFQRVIIEGSRGDNMRKRKSGVFLLPDAEIRRVILCSGKIFYHLYHAREAAGIRDVTIIRLEQIAPFPHDLLGPALIRFPAAEIIWCQEEPKNMGAWQYVKPRLMTTFRENALRLAVEYIGRKPSSSPAMGGYKLHISEQKDLVDRALMITK
jgi:2-oxoglutarate dehydrogenase complex dehydrogenase (E1) component-like enzyme